MAIATPQDFAKLDIRIGTIVTAQPFPEARKPAYKLTVDLGRELGIKKSSAQITDLYDYQTLPGKRVLAVVNFAPLQIGPFKSEILVMGFYNAQGHVVLATCDAHHALGNGARLS